MLEASEERRSTRLGSRRCEKLIPTAQNPQDSPGKERSEGRTRNTETWCRTERSGRGQGCQVRHPRTKSDSRVCEARSYQSVLPARATTSFNRLLRSGRSIFLAEGSGV